LLKENNQNEVDLEESGDQEAEAQDPNAM